MKTRRNTGGFTLLELALAVAIIAILSGVTSVNVVHYQRTLTQVELDGIAREIFVAAQNHLTMAESQGFMGIVNDSDWGELYQQGTATEPTIYYYVVKPDTDHDSLNMLNLMLPFASVDETVRTADGSYVIRYQKDPALVLDVFYAPQSGRFHHTFTAGTAGEVNSDWIQEYRGKDNKQARGDYKDEHTIIGWYGVEPEWLSVQSGGGDGEPTPVPKGKTLSPPTVKIVNAERLYVEVTNPNTSDEFRTAGVRLVVTGMQSGVSVSKDLLPSDKNRTSLDPIPERIPFVLDDVTSETEHFYQLFCSDSDPQKNLYPGENITVYAIAYNNHELTNVAESARATTNSLFASLKDGEPLLSFSTYTAKISNFRHLENLDSKISQVVCKSSGIIQDGQPIPDCYFIDDTIVTSAEQTSDMDWDKFCKNIRELRDLLATAKINVFADGGVKSTDDCYLPVTNAGTITYDGGNHTISNVKINVSGTDNAGLFATLGHSSTVTDLQLWNFDVQSSGGNAGALAGLLDGSNVGGADIPGVLAYGAASTIKGKTSVGGLVGEVKGACTIAQSAAAVYVTSNSGDAGGLIGTVSADATAKVTDSYAAGHTTEGNYQKDYAAKGHYNVTSTTGNAGGLIGSSAVTGTAKLTVENSYATTSVKAYANVGGLIGDVAGGKIKDCYVTGYVEGGNYKGAFAGKATNTSFNNDRYLSIVNNMELPNVGNMGNPNVNPFDTPDDYNSYAPCTSGAEPYDKTLKAYYGDKYLFKTISQLNASGTYTADWMKKHYGDWPMPETQVINVKVAP